MANFRSLLLLLGIGLIPTIIAEADNQECRTITTTIPHFGPSSTSITLPTCSGTVTVIVGTPLPLTCSFSFSLISKPHAPTTTHTKSSKTSTPWKTIKTTKTHTTKSEPTTTKITSSSTWSTSSASATPTHPAPHGACLNINPLCALDKGRATGFNIDFYPNRIGGYSNPFSGDLSNYYIVQKLSPLQSSLTNITYFPVNDPGSGPALYPNTSIGYNNVPGSYVNFPSYAGYTRETNGGITVDANNFTLVYSGLFRAPSSGAWQLCTTVDNENDVYFGDGNAFSCLTGRPGSAADPVLMYNPNRREQFTERKCVTVELVEGAYYPVRSVMGNWQGPSALELVMVPPRVDAVTGGSHDFSGVAYPKDCGIFL